jgi:RND family efflux transporter MFP subunit
MNVLRKLLIGAIVALAAAAIAVTLVAQPSSKRGDTSKPAAAMHSEEATAAVVTVIRVTPADFTETVLATGSLVPREEILVGPEVEGLRVTEVLADEGQRVKKGDVLARLVSDTLEAQLAQNEAGLARAAAAIARAKAAIVEAEARVTETRNAFERAKPLKAAGHMADAAYDQREQAARTSEAQLLAAQDGLKVAQAEKAQIEAQHREINWRRGRTEVVAPADGIISRRMARVGGFAAGAAEPMFRIVAKGEVELDAEVTEMRVGALKEGQKAKVETAGITVEGTVRLVSPEIDKATRLGRVRIYLGDKEALRVGAFARGTIEVAKSHGLAVPASAVLYEAEGAVVQVVRNNRVERQRIATGLAAGALVEVRQGLAQDDLVVARSGTFLRDGDAVRPVLADKTRLSEAR